MQTIRNIKIRNISKPSSVQVYVRTLKAFFTRATREDYIQTNPALKIPVLESKTKVIDSFNPEQAVRLSTAAMTISQ
jgi:site-specific recombinase XerD